VVPFQVDRRDDDPIAFDGCPDRRPTGRLDPGVIPIRKKRVGLSATQYSDQI